MKKKFLFIALSPIGNGLSGGDRIFIELAKQFFKKNFAVSILTWKDGVEMCKRNNLYKKTVSFKLLSLGIFTQSTFILNYFARIVAGIFWALFYNLKNDFQDTSKVILYSSSDFWMDVIPSIIFKLRFHQVTWVATWFQTAPNPFKGFSEGNRKRTYRFKAFFYWISQFPMKPLITYKADFVLVNNETERFVFPQLDKKNRVFVFLGAVNLDHITKWRKKHPTPKHKKYTAVFQGRFHPQKGVVELIQIWEKVVKKNPNAKLAMIGDGPLMTDVRLKIKELELQKNISLFGYVFDGNKKYSIFQNSKVVVHPSLYDSGGMAASEAMAFDLPAVGFNLKSYKSYYPKGMIKVPINNLDEFACSILKLLSNKKLYAKTRMEAYKLIHDNWSWKNRAEMILNTIN